MKILLTGSTGMVGKNILESPDLKPETKKYKILNPTSAELNLLNAVKVEDYLSANRPDLIIHAAGRVGGIMANMKNQSQFLSENMMIGMNLLLGAKKVGVPNFLNLGSSCMYPRNAPNPLKEELVLKGELEPTNEGYGIAKCAVAKLAEFISKETPSLKYKTIIPCNLYGRWDKFDPEHSHMVPAVIVKIIEAKKNNSKVVVWNDGSSRREFMYCADLADFIFSAIPKFDQLPDYLNVGLGHDYSILDYYKTIAKCLEYNTEFEFDLSKPAGMKQKLVDTSRLSQFGWKAKTSLESGILKTIEFYQRGA